ncbi:asparagine synthase (glutamine-hydrolyzing) [Clostridium novyi]
MCGIVGIFTSEKFNYIDTLNKMLFKIAHRGPNSTGHEIFNVNNNILGLGHKRLSVIGVDESGRQPMHSYNNRHVIVFNGEIYNYLELKKLLCKRGYNKFKTSTDTEVILGLYEVFGEKCIEHLNGMFSFCIYDIEKKKMFIARDRLGVKPLYYFNKKGIFAFSSEIKSLLELPMYCKEVDLTSLTDYLKYRYVRNPSTMFRGIYKLEPGQYITIENNKIEFKKYWDIHNNTTNYIDEKHIEHLLIDSVRLRMRADVPVGAFLSGGIDSSLIVALMSKNTDKKIHTYSIGFEESKFSELKHAKLLADYIGTNHREIVINSKDIMDNFEKCIYYRDEPISETSEIATYILAREAQKEVKVVLSGEGSDECFAGYPKYSFDHFSKYNGIFHILNTISKKVPYKNRKIMLAIKALSIEKNIDRYNYWFSSFYGEELNRIINKNMINFIKEENIYNNKISNISNDLNRMQYYDIKYWLTDNLLDRADKMLMANSIEGRVPFLDYRLVEASFNLIYSQKINRYKGKYIIKEIAKKYLPNEIINRKKSGFYIPVAEWFRKELKDYVTDILFSKKFKERGIFNYTEIERLVSNHLKGVEDNYKKIWMLLSLENWFRIYID